jgi:transcriptional regulator with XRE-family HTH domain
MVASVPHHFDTPTTRAAVVGAVLAELDSLGDRLASFREAAGAEMERLAAFRWVTELAGIRGTDVAERAGVSRQTLNNLRSADRAADYDWPVDLRVMLELGLRGPQSSDGLAGMIARPPVGEFQVEAAVKRLAMEELIAVAAHAASGATAPTTYWRLTARGVEELPRRLRHAAMPASRAWTAYVISSSAEANAIAAAGERALGEHGVAVIPAGTVSGMPAPEIAFTVEAPDPRSAEIAAVALFGELRARAGMTPRQGPVVVSALVAPLRSASL